MGDKLSKHNQQRRLAMITLELIDYFQIILQSVWVLFLNTGNVLARQYKEKVHVEPELNLNGLIPPRR